MNTNLAVRNEGPWPIAPISRPTLQLGPGQRTYSAANDPRFPDAHADHPPLALAGARRGRARLAGAILVSLADHAGLSRLGHARGQSADGRGQRRAIARAGHAGQRTRIDFVATQVGLLGSQSVAERTAQELNLANNPDVVPQDVDASQRLRAATGDRPGGPQGHRARRGPADQVQLQFDLAAARGADRQRHRRQLHQHRAPAALRSVGLRPQFPRAADQQDPRRPRAVRTRGGRLCPAAGHHQHRQRTGADGKRRAATPIRCRANRWSS